MAARRWTPRTRGITPPPVAPEDPPEPVPLPEAPPAAPAAAPAAPAEAAPAVAEARLAPTAAVMEVIMDADMLAVREIRMVVVTAVVVAGARDANLPLP